MPTALFIKEHSHQSRCWLSLMIRLFPDLRQPIRIQVRGHKAVATATRQKRQWWISERRGLPIYWWPYIGSTLRCCRPINIWESFWMRSWTGLHTLMPSTARGRATCYPCGHLGLLMCSLLCCMLGRQPLRPKHQRLDKLVKKSRVSAAQETGRVKICGGWVHSLKAESHNGQGRNPLYSLLEQQRRSNSGWPLSLHCRTERFRRSFQLLLNSATQTLHQPHCHSQARWWSVQL